MATGNFASIADQVKLDVLPKDYAAVNAATRKEIARTFICEPIKKIVDSSCHLLCALKPIHLQVKFKDLCELLVI
jgi:hypothetical protein